MGTPNEGQATYLHTVSNQVLRKESTMRNRNLLGSALAVSLFS